MLSKWKNLKRWQKWVVVLVCLAVLGKVFEITGLAPKTKTEPVKTVQTASSSSKAKPKTSKPSSSAKASSSKSEEKATKESSSSEEKNLKVKLKNQVLQMGQKMLPLIKWLALSNTSKMI